MGKFKKVTKGQMVLRCPYGPSGELGQDGSRFTSGLRKS